MSQELSNDEGAGRSFDLQGTIEAANDSAEAPADAVQTGVGSTGFDPRLMRVRQHVSLKTMIAFIGAMVCVSIVTCGFAFGIGGHPQLMKASSAAVMILVISALGGLVMLKPVDTVNFIGLVYFSVLLRMGLGLGGVLIMRQIDTPWFGIDWVGYLVFFYSTFLLLETFLIVRHMQNQQKTAV